MTETTYKQDQLRIKGRLRYLRGGRVLWDKGTLDLGIKRFKRLNRGSYLNGEYKRNAWTPENLNRATKFKVKDKEK